MRKIHILKAIVDLVWIFSMPIVLLIIGVVAVIFFIDVSSLNITINTVVFNNNDILSKVLIVISALNYLLIIAALYYFRKTIHYFLRVKIFEDFVINSFKKIGNLLAISGIISLIISFVSKVYLTSTIHFEFGLNEHVVLICLGLFFLILSEIFKIAKNHKLENDLTI